MKIAFSYVYVCLCRHMGMNVMVSIVTLNSHWTGYIYVLILIYICCFSTIYSASIFVWLAHPGIWWVCAVCLNCYHSVILYSTKYKICYQTLTAFQHAKIQTKVLKDLAFIWHRKSQTTLNDFIICLCSVSM